MTLRYSCLENSMGRRAWWATVHGVAKSCTRADFVVAQKALMEETDERATVTVQRSTRVEASRGARWPRVETVSASVLGMGLGKLPSESISRSVMSNSLQPHGL